MQKGEDGVILSSLFFCEQLASDMDVDFSYHCSGETQSNACDAQNHLPKSNDTLDI